jgi:class 3 adenylate cyclase
MIRSVAGALGGRFGADPVDEPLGPGDPYLRADPGLQRQAGPGPFGRLAAAAQAPGEAGPQAFDSPARAIGCAESVRDGARALGLPVCAGAHTGEMEHGPAGEVRGIAVHTGARVAALAGAGEILVSRTIRDLVAGAPIRLESRGTHELKGVPGSWEIFAVTG